MSQQVGEAIGDVIGRIPYRMAFAGGWIDQPFVSKLNPSPPGSMVVVGLEPTFRFMERAGLATGTRNIGLRIWDGRLPAGKPDELVRQLYEEENRGKAEPSGSQDMIGLIYPGVNRLDYDASVNGGVFPSYIESNNNLEVARWLERVINVVPVAPRPVGFNPLETLRLSADRIQRLGQTGKDCFDAILKQDAVGLGGSMNECMECWEAILPNTVRHSTIKMDLVELLKYYQSKFDGAMYSGCGGGYLYVVSESDVPGAFRVNVRVAQEADGE